MCSELGQTLRRGTTSVTSNCVLLSMPTLIGTQLWSFRIHDVGHFRQAQNDNEKHNALRRNCTALRFYIADSTHCSVQFISPLNLPLDSRIPA